MSREKTGFLQETETTLFTIRAATACDLVYLMMICEDVGMPGFDDYKNNLVAVDKEDIPVGFIRILKVCDNDPPTGNGSFIYPVAVFRQWQGFGVGRALVDRALVLFGPLKLVACSTSQGFYERERFVKADWDVIAQVIAHDCDLCPQKDVSCTPQPYTFRST
jgi:GNAT superfamily N-acetyltransferase